MCYNGVGFLCPFHLCLSPNVLLGMLYVGFASVTNPVNQDIDGCRKFLRSSTSA